MILAAGRGTRLASLGLQVPKALVDLGGEPLLGRQISYLEAQGVRRIVVNAHHLAEQVTRFVENYRGGAAVTAIVERHLLGTAGGVRNALDLLGRSPFFVLYGDVIVGAPLLPMLDAHSRMRVDATLATYESRETKGKGTVQVDADGLITEFTEKTDDRPPRPVAINAGLYVVDRSLILDFVPEGSVSDFGHDVFPAALAANRRLAAHRLSGLVFDVGTPEVLEAVRELY